MDARPPRSVGLAGDGDEVAAIEAVERAFGVVLDDRDSRSWRTAGDLFESLLEALPPEALTDRAAWPRFAEALALESGVDPRRLTRDSPLLLPGAGRGRRAVKGGLAFALLCLATFLLIVLF